LDIADTEHSITTLQAAMVFNYHCNVNGVDKIGWSYFVQAANIARDIQLFQHPTEKVSTKMLQVRTFTAWCFFNWQA
jgi:hypothetical protein